MKDNSSRQPGLFPHLLTALSCLFLLLAAGCATNNKEAMMHQPTNLGLGRYKTATVEVGSNMSRKYDDLDEYELRLETEIISALRKNHAFEKVYPVCNTPSDLQISITLTNISDGGNYDHYRIGFLAGEAVIGGTLEFRENATGKILYSTSLESIAFFYNEILTNTAKAVDHLAAQITDLISRNLATDGSKETAKLQNE
jgi:hypothetical protein